MAYPAKPVCCRPWCPKVPVRGSRFCAQHDYLIRRVRESEKRDAIGRRLSPGNRPTNW